MGLRCTLLFSHCRGCVVVHARLFGPHTPQPSAGIRLSGAVCRSRCRVAAALMAASRFIPLMLPNEDQFKWGMRDGRNVHSAPTAFGGNVGGEGKTSRVHVGGV